MLIYSDLNKRTQYFMFSWRNASHRGITARLCVIKTMLSLSFPAFTQHAAREYAAEHLSCDLQIYIFFFVLSERFSSGMLLKNDNYSSVLFASASFGGRGEEPEGEFPLHLVFFLEAHSFRFQASLCHCYYQIVFFFSSVRPTFLFKFQKAISCDDKVAEIKNVTTQIFPGERIIQDSLCAFTSKENIAGSRCEMESLKENDDDDQLNRRTGAGEGRWGCRGRQTA